jgi:hypothetical protein
MDCHMMGEGVDYLLEIRVAHGLHQPALRDTLAPEALSALAVLVNLHKAIRDKILRRGSMRSAGAR